MRTKKSKGRKTLKETNIIENTLYSSFIFIIASGRNYPKSIADYFEKDYANVFRQLNNLEAKGFITHKIEGNKNVFPFEKKIYSVNWTKIIQEFLNYIKENIDYVSSENKRLGLNLENNIRGFNNLVEQSKDPTFAKQIKENIYLINFFSGYYSEIAELKDFSWSIKATFDFLSFFGNLNFLYTFGHSHPIFNAEKCFYMLANSKMQFFPNDWDLNKDKEKETEEEQFERFKKIQHHTNSEFQTLEKERKEKIDKYTSDNPQVVQLFVLHKILDIIKIKPTLQLGLNKGVQEVGELIFNQTIEPKEKKEYFSLLKKYNLFHPTQDIEIIEKALKESEPTS